MAFNSNNTKPADLILWLMKLLGLWTFKKSIWNKYYRYYSWLLHFIATFLFILAMYINVALSKTLQELSNALYMSLTEIALFVKVLNVMINIEKAVEFMTIFQHFTDGIPKDKEELKIMAKAHNDYERLRNFHVGGSMLTLLISFFPPLLVNDYSLPFPCYLPFDYKNDEKYFYAYGYVMFGMAITCMSNYTIDLFQSYLMLHLSIYFDLLGHRLRNFGYNKDDADELLNKHFDFHAAIARLKEDVEQFLSFPLAFQFVLSSFVLCFTTYKLKNTDFNTNPSAFLMFVVLACIMSLQIYLPCKYGDQLTTSANELTNAIYASNWFHLPLTTKKKIFIYMEYLKQPIVVKASIIFNVGLNLFAQIMNNAYRLYALLLNVEN